MFWILTLRNRYIQLFRKLLLVHGSKLLRAWACFELFSLLLWTEGWLIQGLQDCWRSTQWSKRWNWQNELFQVALVNTNLEVRNINLEVYPMILLEETRPEQLPSWCSELPSWCSPEQPGKVHFVNFISCSIECFFSNLAGLGWVILQFIVEGWIVQSKLKLGGVWIHEPEAVSWIIECIDYEESEFRTRCQTIIEPEYRTRTEVAPDVQYVTRKQVVEEPEFRSGPFSGT